MKPIKQLLITTILFFNINLASAQQDELHSLNLQDADIRLLIETVSDITNKNFVVDPQVQGKVTVISGHPVSQDEIYNIFLSILSVNGLAAVKDGNSFKIIPENDAGGIIGEFSVAHDSDFVTRIVPLKYVPATELVSMLKGITNQKAKIIAHKDSNILIISDRAKNVERMIGIISRIDRKSDSSIDMIALQHARASEVAQTIETLLDTGNSTLNGKTKIVADERTNSVIINADPSLKLRIQTLIAQLDSPLETNTQSQVIKLKYSDAESLVPILETMANASQQSEGEGSSPNQTATIQAHKETNSLVINAPPTVFKNLQSAIKQLDVKRPQVLVEAIIVELTVDHSKEAGFQWQSLLSEINGDSGVIGGTNYGIIGNILNPTGGINGGLNVGYVSSLNEDGTAQIGALLSALAKNSNNNILSTPSLVTLNNKEAKLSVGQEVPFLTGQFTNTGGNEGATNPFSTIQRKDIGVSLTVTPHIYEGDQIVLDIAQEVSSLSASATTVDVITNKRTLTTSVMVANDGVIVLGGLIDDTIQEDIQKVPLLGDIPVLRNLFRHKKKTRVKRNLMIFIHPLILDDGNQTEITNKMYDDIRQQQLQKINETEFSKGKIILPEKINQK